MSQPPAPPSDPQPPTPPWTPPGDVYYESPSPQGNAAMLVKLMYIFNFIMAGLDGLFAVVLVCVALFLPAFLDRLTAGTPGATTMPKALLTATYSVEAVLSLAVAIVKAIAAYQVMKRSRGAWGWGLAAAICGCLQLWCSLLCILPIGVSVFSFVVLMRQDSRAYLQGGSPTALPPT